MSRSLVQNHKVVFKRLPANSALRTDSLYIDLLMLHRVGSTYVYKIVEATMTIDAIVFPVNIFSRKTSLFPSTRKVHSVQ